jgi:outer membrane protein assembly factor BamB
VNAVAVRALLIACAIVLVACGGHAVGAASGPAAAAPNAASPAAVPGGDWMTFDFNTQRSGVALPSGITAGNVRSLRTRVVHIDGTVDSSAVELHAVKIAGRFRDAIFVTTTYGKTIAIDPGTGRKLWEFTPSSYRSLAGSAQITTATPVIDPQRAYLYASSPDGLVHKLAIATGREVRSGHWPVRVTLLPSHEKLASPLTINGNELIVVTDGYDGDAPPYQGHVVTIDRGSGRILHVWNSLCSDRRRLLVPSTCPGSDSAIWGRNAPVLEPGTGRILVATGNGPFNGRTDWGDSVLELTPDASRLLHNWTPRNQAQLNSNDQDLGSTSPALLPVVRGYRLAVQGGKAGILSLLNLNRMNGTTGGAGPRTGGELQNISSPGGDMVFSAPAVWSHPGGPYVFVADSSGTAAYVLRFRHGPRLVTAWQNGTAGTSPVLSGGLLYVYDQNDGALKVYVPASGRLLASFAAAGGHWNSPIAIGGRVIVPTGDANDHDTTGELFIFHLRGS